MSQTTNRNVPRRSILWFASVAMVLFTVLMAFFFTESGWHTAEMAFVAVCGAIAFGLVVTLISASRFWWGMRIVSFILFAISFWFLVDEGFLHPHPTRIDDPGAPSMFNAIRMFLFFGLPSLLYTLWGSTWGKLGTSNPRNIDKSDIFTLRVAVYGRWLFLGMTLVVLLAAIMRS